MQKLNRLLKDTNRAEQSQNLPLSDRTAAGLRLNLHSQPAKQPQIGVCLRSLYLPVTMFEPGGGGVLLRHPSARCLIQIEAQNQHHWWSWARFVFSKRAAWMRGARQEALSSASVLAGAVARGW